MLTLNNVSAGYNGVEVLTDITLSIDERENLCILGSNGCGKTTLIKAIAGLIPSKGKIQIDGREISNMKRSELAGKIAVMSQISSVYFSYSVYETVLLGRYIKMKSSPFKRPSQFDMEYTEKCLKAVGIYKLRDNQISTLSGGQLQRVYLARTLAQEPNIILLDEPTNHLDLKHQVELIEYLKEWSNIKGHSVIGVLHDINLAMCLADKVLLLKDGKMEGYGRSEDIITPNRLESVYGIDVVKHMLNSLKRWETIDTDTYKIRKIN